MNKKIYIVAGEESGDWHASEVLQHIKKNYSKNCNLEIRGFGGKKMQTAYPQIQNWLEESSVLGLWEVIKKYSYFKTKMQEMLAELTNWQPDTVILVDYPGFNLRFASALRKKNFTGKIIFYISPQIWAWKKGRAKKMAQILDIVLCIFPFEAKYFTQHNLPAEFVGHPFYNTVKPTTKKRNENLIAFFPGSRVNEIKKHMPAICNAIKIILKKNPNLEIAISSANTTIHQHIKEFLKQTKTQKAKIVSADSTPASELMQTAQAGAVASGTATLQAAFCQIPYCLIYKISPITFIAAKLVVKLKHIGIVNILAKREIIKEFIQGNLTGENLAQELLDLQSNEKRRSQMLNEFKKSTEKLNCGNSYENTARAIWETTTQPHPEKSP